MSRWPVAVVLQGLALGLLGVGVLALRPVDLLSSLAIVLTLLTGLKLWEARQLQERRLVCLLQLLCAGLQGALQPDLAASLLQGAAVVVALAGLLALEVGGGGTPWVVLLRRSVGGVVAALPMALVLFLLVPRLPPIGVLPGGWGAAAVTGLSDTLEPGSIAVLATSTQPAARVSFASGVPPPPEARQWRVLVHEAFDGERWTVRPEDPALELEAWRQAQEGRGPLSQVWLSEANPLERLPWSGAGSPSNRQLRVTAQGELVHRGIRGQRRAYGLTAAASRPRPWQLERPGPALLALPPGVNPRLEALGRSWASGPPLERLRRVERWMRSQPFRYTRQPGVLPAQAPLDVFLFDRQQGFCGHFASATSALLRAAGLPARVVSGYQGGSWVQPLSGPGYLDLRQGDAHAWSEVWIEGTGWMAVDPSRWVAGMGAVVAPLDVHGDHPFAWLERQWWGLDLAWTRWWLGYDARSQEALLARLLGDRFHAWGWLLLAAVAAALVGGLALLGWLRRRGTGDPLRRELDRCLLAFARRGWLSRPGETLPQLAARLRQRWPELDPELGAFVARYEAQRFGPAPAAKARELQDLRRCRERLLRRWRQLR